MTAGVDAIFILSSFAAPLAVTYGMLGHGAGGGASLSTSFTWHPILMSFAFPCLMVLGRWVYVTESLGDKQEQRSAHRGLMILSTLVAIGGYVAIFMSHAKIPSFFGYNFAKHTWAVPARICHDFLGYSVLLAMLYQAAVGIMKYRNLEAGQRSFPFHGSLGKVILLLGPMNIVTACLFWGWSPAFKVLVACLASLAALCGAFWPAPAKPESAPLAESMKA
ncbi:PGLP2 [Symbiodinium natans]|uniref:PGLP2 protein n=1 Tax=Symbiodinium natans TaxID=878477 RepID=A0A812TV70_9DINO|nr:PGLP2 [Symbiodinium natans]